MNLSAVYRLNSIQYSISLRASQLPVDDCSFMIIFRLLSQGGQFLVENQLPTMLESYKRSNFPTAQHRLFEIAVAHRDVQFRLSSLKPFNFTVWARTRSSMDFRFSQQLKMMLGFGMQAGRPHWFNQLDVLEVGPRTVWFPFELNNCNYGKFGLPLAQNLL